jgi:hypothetical protein
VGAGVRGSDGYCVPLGGCFIIAIDTCIFIVIHVAYRIASYFSFIFSLQIACWIAFILYVCQLEKIRFFRRKIVIFHTKYPKNFRASLRKWKKYNFLV